MKKIQVGFLLSYDYEKLKNSIPPVYNSADAIFIAIDKKTGQIGIFDCSDAFYESGKDKVQQAVEQYKLFYDNPDFDPKNYFINKTL